MRCGHQPGDYLDAYFSRVFHRGESVAEVAKNTGERSFESWLASSIHTVKDLSVERGLYFSGIILTNKDKEHQKIMFLNVANDIPIVIGDIVNWGTEKWIIFQKEKKVCETYQTFLILQCNYLLKWIDFNGHLQQSWGHFTSSLDSKVKENFRTWNSLITPQPNKYAEIIMPRQDIRRDTSFIIEEEAWSMVEYDHSSVPGIIYLSLTEEKLNYIYDINEEKVADIDRLANYQIITDNNKQIFTIGNIINPAFTITKNGKPVEINYKLVPENKKIAKVINGALTAVGEGETSLIIQFDEYQGKEPLTLDIVVGKESIFSAYIEGVDKIRLSREAGYKLVGNSIIDQKEVKFYLSENNGLALDIQPDFNSDNELKHIYRVKANDKNKLGMVVLNAEYQGIKYTKEISIIPLW